ncbi:hypothetical protein JX266_008363 [Neoarthrinium moseri]|nr:hypothetical protein JX266_008363 [Neoarthrinium moseri]
MSPATPGVLINVLYPASAASGFDLDYYLHTHMPLVDKHWRPHGLLGWTVAVMDGSTSGYHVQAIMTFEDLEAFESVMEMGEIMADINNFTSARPVRWVGKVVGEGS